MAQEIPVWKHDQIVAHALVDDADVERVAAYRWTLSPTGYARRHVNSKVKIALHRFILGLEGDDARQGDHENRNRLDCRRSNLRIVTNAQNAQNKSAIVGTSRYRGVCWVKSRSRWLARVRQGDAVLFYRYFESEMAAALAVEQFRLDHLPFYSPDPLLAGAVGGQRG